MYGYTVHVKRFMVQATATAFVTVGFSFDDELTVNSKDELSVATSPICPVAHHPRFSTTPALGAPPLLSRGGEPFDNLRRGSLAGAPTRRGDSPHFLPRHFIPFAGGFSAPAMRGRAFKWAAFWVPV